MNTNQGLIQALPMIAVMLGRSAGVEVVIGQSSSAWTNGKTINLPALPLQDDCTEALALGWIVHEAAHIRFTDFSLLKNVSLTPLEHALCNAYEDFRIDREMARIYPGAESRRNGAIAAMKKKGIFLDPQGKDVGTAVVAYVLARLTGRFLARSQVLELEQTALEEIEKQLSPAIAQKIADEVDSSTDLSSTEDAYHAAMRISRMLQDEADKARDDEQNQQDQTQGADSSDDSQGQDGSGTSSDDSQGQGDSQAASGEADDAGDAGDGAASTSGAEPSQSSSQGKSEKGLADEIENLLSSTPEFNGELGDEMKAAMEQSARTAGLNGQPESRRMWVPELRQDYSTPHASVIVGRAREASTALSSRLESLLLAHADTSRMYAASGPRLVGSRMWKVKTGNANVFRRRSEEIAVNTAIYVLLDTSSSMSGSVHTVADAGLALALALENVPDVVSQVVAFPYGTHNYLLKGFDETTRSSAGRFTGLHVNGSTPMAEAMLRAGVELGCRDEDRRILLVVTDGQPDSISTTTHVMSVLQAEGVETLGIGINVEVNELFTASRRIDSVNDLPSAMFSLLMKQLEKLPFAA